MKKKGKSGLFGKVGQYFRPFTTMGDISGGMPSPIKAVQVDKQFGQGKKPAAPKPPKKMSRVKMAVVIVIALLCLGTAGVSASKIYAKDTGATANKDWDQYFNILTKEEKKEWEEKQQQRGKAYVQMNTRIEMGSVGKAQIRLINPPYSNYDQNVIISMKEDKRDVFQSGLMHPGTVIEYTNIPNLEIGEYEAVANFSFYNLEGVEKGSYALDIKFEVVTEGDLVYEPAEDDGEDNFSLDIPIAEQDEQTAMPEMDATTPPQPTDAEADIVQQTGGPSFGQDPQPSGPSFQDESQDID